MTGWRLLDKCVLNIKVHKYKQNNSKENKDLFIAVFFSFSIFQNLDNIEKQF